MLYSLSTVSVVTLSKAAKKDPEKYKKMLDEHPELASELVVLDYRTPGIFETFEEAEKTVRDNVCDINERNYYNIAVIDEIQPGLYPIAETTHYYSIWSEGEGDTYRYEASKLEANSVPDCLKKFMWWGIG